MRKVIFALLISLISILFFSSCAKTNDIKTENSDTKFINLFENISPYENLGYLHNIGLEYLRANTSFDEKTSSDSLTNQSIFILNNGIEINSLIFREIDSINLSVAMNEVYNKKYIYDIDKIFDLIYTSSILSSDEVNLILTIKDAYEDLLLNLNDDSIEKFRLLIDSNIDKYNNYKWENNEGEAAGGYLYILKASFDYWFNEDLNNDLKVEPIVLVQVDAAGYLFGWFKAWLWDELPTPQQRMKAGLGTALQFSFVRGLGWVIK